MKIEPESLSHKLHCGEYFTLHNFLLLLTVGRDEHVLTDGLESFCVIVLLAVLKRI
jgi:hypothetical protein